MNNPQTAATNFELIEAQSAYMKSLRRNAHKRTVRAIKAAIKASKLQGNVWMESLLKRCLRIYRTGYDL
ncbi:hypothetical protein EQM14_01450 [Caproiciproducens sp. NJN-50]|uniref:hypothetical protein n=1 Tax=Caproiciproducens sp. NJN-50 TaxID=2507162 RepID=UPI000FFE28EA|nr:hypothetical protein [Caproiciproducens sp. NJN-50]QAT48550.1 hypothetical protein EQM14_01450 [Caproiciproducens sp. NJN-50]